MASLEIKLSRYNRVYRPGDVVEGQVTVSTRGGVSHGGIKLLVDGGASMQLSANSVGLFEAFSSNVKPVTLLHVSKELQAAGKLPDGRTVLSFSFPLQPSTHNRPLLDTYHGVYLCVQYTLTIELQKSGMFGQPASEATEFIVEVPTKDKPAATPQSFTISEGSTKKSKGALDAGQKFSLSGGLDSTTSSVTKPLTGHIQVDNSTHSIKSIAMQLVRVEVVQVPGESSTVKEVSEVQSIQAANGTVCEGLQVPLHMVLPRLFCAPSATFTSFQLDFEVNVVVEFENGYSAFKNFPLKLYR